MAGIGFRLRNLLKEETYLSDITAHLYSAVIAAGPWIFSIISLAAITTFSIPLLSKSELALFRATMVYTFIFSLVINGMLQLLISKFIADRFYLRDPTLGTTLTGTICLTAGISFVSATVFYLFSNVSPLYKVAAIGLFVTMSCLWLVMSFLSVLRDYKTISFAFLEGNIIGLGTAMILGRHFRLEGWLIGFSLGQATILFVLIYQVLRETGWQESNFWDFYRYFKLFPQLVFIGLFYSLAIWVDKWILWFSPQGYAVWSLFRTHYPYDSAMFLAYLTVVPTLGVFLLKVETSFYEKFRGYYDAILDRAGLKELEMMIEEIKSSLRESFGTLLRIQGLITILAILFAPKILRLIGWSPLQLGIFRLGTFGSFFHIMALITIIILCYFEFWKAALLVTGTFLVTNTLFTLITLKLGPAYYGLGYAVSSLLTFIVAVTVLWHNLKSLNYRTFSGQPVPPAIIPLPNFDKD
ncbi:MAG: exopolysaccharide Pel transporter PelG [Nitrospirae bacterium]|nr:exopolysaccharide Pel transporter PelG [Nitrospirota bacterium]